MLFVLLCPFIGMIIYVIVAIVAVFGEKHCGTGSSPSIDVSIPQASKPQEEGYVDKRTIAEKFDGRLTNIFKNPFDGIL